MMKFGEKITLRLLLTTCVIKQQTPPVGRARRNAMKKCFEKCPIILRWLPLR